MIRNKRISSFSISVLQTIKLQYRTGFAQTGKCSYAQTIHVHNLK